MTITDDGYVAMAETFMSSVLRNVETSDDWTMTDAVVLVVSAMAVSRKLSDDNFKKLISLLGERNTGKPVVIREGVLSDVLG